MPKVEFSREYRFSPNGYEVLTYPAGLAEVSEKCAEVAITDGAAVAFDDDGKEAEKAAKEAEKAAAEEAKKAKVEAEKAAKEAEKAAADKKTTGGKKK